MSTIGPQNLPKIKLKLKRSEMETCRLGNRPISSLHCSANPVKLVCGLVRLEISLRLSRKVYVGIKLKKQREIYEKRTLKTSL